MPNHQPYRILVTVGALTLLAGACGSGTKATQTVSTPAVASASPAAARQPGGPAAAPSAPRPGATAASTGAAGGAARIDPCTLATRPEAEAAFGKPVDDGQSLDDVSDQLCTFFDRAAPAKRADSPQGIVLRLNRRRGTEAATFFATFRDAVTGRGRIVDLPGVGSSAWMYRPERGVSPQVHLLANGSYVIVTLRTGETDSSGGAATDYARLVELAKKVASRL